MDVITAGGKITDLDKLTNWCNQKGIYLILDPHFIENQPGAQLPNNDVLFFMQSLAERYKSKSNVLYGLWNEPGEATLEEWWPWAVNIAIAIRDKNSNSILLVSGTQWSRDFRYLQDHPFPFQQDVIYDVHDYMWGDGQQDIRPWWTWMIGRYSILLGEFGGAQEGNKDVCPYQSECDLAYTRDTLAIVNSNPKLLHYTAFQMEPSDDGLTNPDGSLTPTGELIKSDLQAYPGEKVAPH